jgi:hypothetical protein
MPAQCLHGHDSRYSPDAPEGLGVTFTGDAHERARIEGLVTRGLMSRQALKFEGLVG